jgi:hypothetical protein
MIGCSFVIQCVFRANLENLKRMEETQNLEEKGGESWGL